MLKFSATRSTFNGMYEYKILCDRCGKLMGYGHEERNNVQTRNICTECDFKIVDSEKHQKYKRCVLMARLLDRNATILRYAFYGNPDLQRKLDRIYKFVDKWLELSEKFK